MNKSETVVIIPNYNGLEYLNVCLSSVFSQSYKDFTVVFVDDFSSDKSVSLVKETFPQVDIILNEENLGFTKSVNKAIEYSAKKYQPKYIALLNNDTKPDNLWLEKLKEKIQVDNTVVAVTSNMLFMDDPSVVNSQGGKCDFLCTGSDINFGVKLSDIKEIKEKVLSPCFGACLIKSEAFDNVGLLDGRYSTYCEDLDWGMRANMFGFSVLFEEKAVIYHKGSATYGANLPRKTYLCKRNSLCTMIKNYGAINLLKSMFILAFHYPTFFIGSLMNLKIKNGRFINVYENIGFSDRLKCALAPILGLFWNIWNIRITLRLRKDIQMRGIVDDKDIMNLSF